MSKKQDSKDNLNIFGGILIGIIIGAALMAVIFGLVGISNDPFDRLGIDKDLLAKDYVVSYYPEYANCSFKYYSDIYVGREGKQKVGQGVRIYCNILEDRDGLSMAGTKSKDYEVIYFKNITLKQILINKLEEIEQ